MAKTGQGFGGILQGLLDERKLSIRAFARLLADPDADERQIENQRTTAMRWLSSKNAPSRRSLVKIAAALNVTLADLGQPSARQTEADPTLALLQELAASLTALQLGQDAILEALGVRVGAGESKPIPPRHLSRQRRTH